jgi:hypothetical protein
MESYLGFYKAIANALNNNQDFKKIKDLFTQQTEGLDSQYIIQYIGYILEQIEKREFNSFDELSVWGRGAAAIPQFKDHINIIRKTEQARIEAENIRYTEQVKIEAEYRNKERERMEAENLAKSSKDKISHFTSNFTEIQLEQLYNAIVR